MNQLKAAQFFAQFPRAYNQGSVANYLGEIGAFYLDTVKPNGKFTPEGLKKAVKAMKDVKAEADELSYYDDDNPALDTLWLSELAVAKELSNIAKLVGLELKSPSELGFIINKIDARIYPSSWLKLA